MNKVIFTYTSLDPMKADEYREWQELPPHERMTAVAELTLAAYRTKEPALDVRPTTSKNSCPSSTHRKLSI
jgi:hypothetical protein